MRVAPLFVPGGGVRAFHDPARQPVQLGVDFVAAGFGLGRDAGRDSALDRVGAVGANTVNRARERFRATPRLESVLGSRSITDMGFNLPAR